MLEGGEVSSFLFEELALLLEILVLGGVSWFPSGQPASPVSDRPQGPSRCHLNPSGGQD